MESYLGLMDVLELGGPDVMFHALIFSQLAKQIAKG